MSGGSGTFVKLDRAMKDWQWFGDSNTVHVLIYLLMEVNWQPKQWQGMTIEPGSKVTSRAKIAAATGLTEKQVRLALDRLEKCNTITRKGAGLGQLISIVNWAKYQYNSEDQGRTRADGKAEAGPDKGQSLGREKAAIKEEQELKNPKKGKKVAPSAQEPLMMIWPEWAGENTLAKWEAFKVYKAEQHRFKYKSGNSEQAAINLLAKWFTKGRACVEALDEAMARGWMFPVDPGTRTTPMSGNGHAAPSGYGKAEAEAEEAAIRKANGRDPVWGPVYDSEMSPQLIEYNKSLLKNR